MKIESVSVGSSVARSRPSPAEEVAEQRKRSEQAVDEEKAGKSNVQPEEFLDRIQALTEDGLYSVRFETDRDTKNLVIQVVDQENDEVIRQIPPEEILDLTKRMDDLRGIVVNVQG